MDTSTDNGRSLLCRVGARYCALPLEGVVETTRPLPIEPIPGAPDFVLGVSIVRGSAVPIVDAARLLGVQGSSPTRFVVLRVKERRVGLAVESVVGVRSMSSLALGDLPPLLRTADAEVILAIGALDSELLLVLRRVRILPEDLLASLEEKALAS